MTHTIAPPQATPAPTGTLVRMALVFVAAVLLIAAFATGRVTAPENTIRTVVTAPTADGAAQPFECPPSRPPVC